MRGAAGEDAEEEEEDGLEAGAGGAVTFPDLKKKKEKRRIWPF